MLSRQTFFFLTLMLVLALAATATLAQTGDPGEKVLIRTMPSPTMLWLQTSSHLGAA